MNNVNSFCCRPAKDCCVVSDIIANQPTNKTNRKLQTEYIKNMYIKRALNIMKSITSIAIIRPFATEIHGIKMVKSVYDCALNSENAK